MEICVKTIVVDMKSPIDELKSRIGTAEELITTLENLTESLSHRKQENIMTENVKEKLSNVEAISRRANIWILGIQERKRNKHREELIFEVIMEINFPDLT